MALRTDPKYGFVYGWENNSDSWGAAVNNNFELMIFLSLGIDVIDRDLTAPPGGESVGDIYIPAATATGDWAGEEGNLAIYWQDPDEGSASWHFVTPKRGLLAYVVDEAKLIACTTDSTWSSGVSI
jgi:hypothetical protein